MKHVILIGFMGCGKSTVGYRLSYRLKRCLIDTDKLIEYREKKKITEIFAEHGEGYFREKETECLNSLFHERASRILALGGGTPLREENRKIIKKLGTVFYLKASPETIYGRVKHDTKRPLLQCEDPKTRIVTLLKERDPIYEMAADHIIVVDGKNMHRIVQEIAEVVERENSGNKRAKH